MKPRSLFCILLVSCTLCQAKARLGNYYFGFAVGRAEYPMAITETVTDSNTTRQVTSMKKLDGVSFEISLNLPISLSSDLHFKLARSDFSHGNHSSHLNEAKLDYLYRFNQVARDSRLFLPFVGLGVQYAELKGSKEKFYANAQTGAEFVLTDSLVFTPRIRYVNSLLDYAINDFEFGASMTWLASKRHALALRYSKSVDAQNYFAGLEYLYSWK